MAVEATSLPSASARRILSVRSPKLSSDRSNDWYRYYAGYSSGFVHDALESLELDEKAIVLDPWNGAGTTTAVAQRQGLGGLGYDANPALVVIARARLLASDVTESLAPLADDILDHAASVRNESEGTDPLEVWFDARSARQTRHIERAVRHVLVNEDADADLPSEFSVNGISSLAAFFYVALFDAVRGVLRPFMSSNPTWIKTPASEDRVAVDSQTLDRSFKAAVDQLVPKLSTEPCAQAFDRVTVDVASSESLPLPDDSVQGAITSPPYCTRIDYVVATRPELAVLGLDASAVRLLRTRMLGTPTILPQTPDESDEWGVTARSLLARIAAHSSHASGSYYRKHFTQYFDSLMTSLKELRRVICGHGGVVIVVQDSYYKELHIDLAQIVCEMCECLGWRLRESRVFSIARTKAAIHRSSRSWRSSFSATESVLLFG